MLTRPVYKSAYCVACEAQRVRSMQYHQLVRNVFLKTGNL
jgi:hypothetical protein